MNKIKRHWKSLCWACVIVALLLIKKVPVEPPKFEIPGMDKVVHFGLFMILSFLVYVEHKRILQKVQWCLVLVIYPVLFGGAMELIQWRFVEGRSGDWLDLLADAAGSFFIFAFTKKGRSYLDLPKT